MRRLGILCAAVLLGVLLAGSAADGQEAACPAGTVLDPVVSADTRPPAGHCVCPSGEVVGWVYTDGSFVPVPPGDIDHDGDCSTDILAPQVEAVTEAVAEPVPGPVAEAPVQAAPGSVLRRTG